jgi:lysophospholipase L1-like esterase
MPNIICFGDSITRGENDHLHGGWADRLKSFFIELFLTTSKNEVCVFNLGIGGETTDGLVVRFKSELLTRLSEQQGDVVVLGYGANDLVWSEGHYMVEPDRYLSHLSACIEMAQSHDAKVLLVDILPISDRIEGKVNELGKLRREIDICLYNNCLNQLAEEYGIDIVRFYAVFNESKERLLTSDGVHPNADGHKLLYQTIQKKIMTMNHEI